MSAAPASRRSRSRAASLCAACLIACAACGRKPQDLTTAQLSRVVDAERPTLKTCYDAALKEHPYQQEMRMQAVIHIWPDGRVSGVELEGGGGLPGMAECLRRNIGQWRFPAARDATHTSLPLIFRPEIVPQPPTLPPLGEILKLHGSKP